MSPTQRPTSNISKEYFCTCRVTVCAIFVLSSSPSACPPTETCTSCTELDSSEKRKEN
uniref:Uncharacterized protein n=1 Tax=Anopheles arabiensis TaxID=7173 RepID=A0A182IHJ8_ANOAR